ncbi:Uncharacterised protein [Bordetella pertussis]|nr:Uncharacterised protein [Bordetella pertussis]
MIPTRRSMARSRAAAIWMSASGALSITRGQACAAQLS